MSRALFIDESGTDRNFSPYEVLAGIAIGDRNIWKLICELADIQQVLFGMRLFDAYGNEAKATELLKRSVFEYAAKNTNLSVNDRKRLTYELLSQQRINKQFSLKGHPFLAALAQTKLTYCREVLRLVQQYGGIAFATIIPKNVLRPANAQLLRKDYNFLFERFYYHLESTNHDIGYLICDELEKKKSHALTMQIKQYFTKTQKGQKRAQLIIPEALFVHSDLTSLIQIADLIAYIICWGFRQNKKLTEPCRPELKEFVDLVSELQFRRNKGQGRYDWGFKVISDLGE